MVDEARMETGEPGKMATGDGWYTLHVSVAQETSDIATAYAGVQRQTMAPVWPRYGID